MERKYLINVEAVKQLGMIEMNVESSKLSNIIYRCQERFIKPVLGKELYQKILDDIEAETLAGKYKDLVDDFVIDYLICAVEKKVVWHTNMKIREKGTGRSSDEYVNPSTIEADNDLRDELSKDMQHFKTALETELKKGEFEEYNKCHPIERGSDRTPYKFSFITRNR